MPQTEQTAQAAQADQGSEKTQADQTARTAQADQAARTPQAEKTKGTYSSTPAAGEKLFIGIDGGGTKTDFALGLAGGRILRRLSLQGSNPTVCGIEKSASVLLQGLEALDVPKEAVRAVFAGIAGCPDERRQKALIEAIKSFFPSAKVDCGADIVNIIYCGKHRDRCVAAICGTGSVAFAKNEKGLFRVGGWGPLFDHAGSGYDVGRDAVRAALAEEDGFGEKTLLTALVREKLGSCVFDGAASLKPDDFAAVAAFAPLVFQAEKAGDKEAARILDRNFARLAFLIETAADKYDCAPHVVLSGGLTSEEATLRKYLERHLNKKLEIEIPHDPPVFGALAAAETLF